MFTFTGRFTAAQNRRVQHVGTSRLECLQARAGLSLVMLTNPLIVET